VPLRVDISFHDAYMMSLRLLRYLLPPSNQQTKLHHKNSSQSWGPNPPKRLSRATPRRGHCAVCTNRVRSYLISDPMTGVVLHFMLTSSFTHIHKQHHSWAMTAQQHFSHFIADIYLFVFFALSQIRKIANSQVSEFEWRITSEWQT
jgi:hypothetical protein